MVDQPSVENEWDFYPCRVDDAPASIYLNLWFAKHAPLTSADTLYWVRIQILDKAEHGMGSAADAELLYPVEDQLRERAQANGFFYVGRLRTDGRWQLAFYGLAGRLDTLQTLANGLDGLDGRKIETGSKPDPDWRYYREFLLPDAERHQWMQDRAVVAVLRERGDPLSIPRRVDHWAFFPTAEARDAFVRDAAREGFVVEPTDATGHLPFAAQVHRIDPVELDHIHEVVMILVELAEQHEGDYDGWETRVEKAPPS